MENKRGGQRLGSGRKPLGLKKESMTLYVEKNYIIKYGSRDKARDRVYELIKADSESIYDGKENKPTAQIDEVGQWQEQKENYFAPTPIEVPLSKRQTYINDLKECKDYEEIKKVMLRSKGEALSNVDRQILNVELNNIMEEKGIEPY